MHDKLELLLRQIGINNMYYNFFENGKLDKIAVSKQYEKAEFLITIDRILPVSIYDQFCELLIRKFNTYDVKENFTVRNVSYEELNNYVNYFAQIFFEEDVNEMHQELNIQYKENVIKFNCSNEDIVDNFKLELEENLERAGFNNIKIIKGIANKEEHPIIKNIKQIKEERIKNVNKLLVKGKEVSLESNLKELGLDSLDVVDMLMDLEEKFGIEFDNEEMMAFTVVNDIVAAIENKTK